MKHQPTLFDLPAPGHKVRKRHASEVEKLQVDHKLAKRRYYLHRQIKDLYHFQVDGAQRTINIYPYASLEEVPVGPKYYVLQLMRFNYNVYSIRPI